MRVVTLTCPGVSQRHLIHRIGSEHELLGCVWMSAPPDKRVSRLEKIAKKLMHPVHSFHHLLARSANRVAESASSQLADVVFKVPEDSPLYSASLPQRFVHDINSAAAVDFVKQLKPDAVIVNGTNLLREPWHAWASQIPLGIINIHTGLSPYSRGGNCNLFAILHGQLQCVGVTVHYIDAGIDSGEIIYTARPRMLATDSYDSIETKVFRLGEDLATLALRRLEAGEAVPRVAQWNKGHEFLKRTGYQYQPYQRVVANRRLHEQGLLEIYLRFETQLNQSARTIEPDVQPHLWRHPDV